MVAVLGTRGNQESISSPAHLILGLNLHQLDRLSISAVRDLGVRYVRYTLYWSLWNQALYREQWERDVSQALRSGLEVLVVVHQPPFGDFSTRRLVYREFARFVAKRAAQFPEIKAWQLWNEMDVTFTDVFGAGRPEISLRRRGQLYADMLGLAYPAIKRANPKALVVVGGIASGIEGGFLDGLYDSHAKYDVLAIHTYGFPLALAFTERGVAMRKLMRAHQDKRPLWNTEFGLEEAVVPGAHALTPAQIDTVQLQAWQQTLDGTAADPLFDRIYGYVLAEGKDLGFSLIRSDGSPRPAYTWLRSWIRNHQARTAG